MNTIKIKNVEIGKGIPKICIPLTGKNREEIIEEMEIVKKSNPDLIEWRVDFFEESDFRYIMDERLIILFELKTTEYKEKRDWFLLKFKQHMAWHLNIEDINSPYIDIITNMFIDCIKHVLVSHDNLEMQKQEFLKVFKMLCTGIVVNEEK